MERSHCKETQELVGVKEEPETELKRLPSPSEPCFNRVNFKEEANVQYSLAECVNVQPVCVNKLKQQSCSDITASEVNETLASPYAKKLKDGPVLSSDRPECDVIVSELTSPYTNMLKDELVLIPEQVKEECGMSEADIVANLYTDHAVKDEIVLGPERPHRPDVTLAVRSWVLADADSWSATPAPVRARLNKLKQVMDCCVRLERLPSDAAMLADNQTKNTTTHVNAKSNTEKKYTSRQSICGLCGEAFTLKTDLIKHVMSHIHIPTSMDKEEKLLSNYETLRSSIRDCRVNLERCDLTNHKPAETMIPSSEKETILQLAIHSEKAEQTKTAIQKIHTPEINYYICDFCSKTFQEKHNLVNHIKMHLERSHMSLKDKNILTNKLTIHECKRKRPYTCELCKKVFRLHRELIRHEIRHSGQKPYSCLICFKRFTRIDRVKVHTETVHHNGEKTFSCKKCQKKFKRLSYLERHKLVHTKRKTYYCNICKKPFKGLDYFKKHTIIHISGPAERKHQCQICYKKFSSSTILKRHQRVHDGLRPYSCEICSKKFSLLHSLKAHVRIHTGQKPYECNTCKKRFTQLGSLNSHTPLHEGIKRFNCEICSKSFMQLTSLNRHKRTQHMLVRKKRL